MNILMRKAPFLIPFFYFASGSDSLCIWIGICTCFWGWNVVVGSQRWSLSVHKNHDEHSDKESSVSDSFFLFCFRLRFAAYFARGLHMFLVMKCNRGQSTRIIMIINRARESWWTFFHRKAPFLIISLSSACRSDSLCISIRICTYDWAWNVIMDSRPLSWWSWTVSKNHVTHSDKESSVSESFFLCCLRFRFAVCFTRDFHICWGMRCNSGQSTRTVMIINSQQQAWWILS